MEILSNPFNGSSKRYLRRRRYHRLDGANTYQKNMKTIRIGGRPKPFWRVKLGSKLRLKTLVLSPLKIWRKFKNAYVNMMVNLVGNVNGNALVGKRIPKARQVQHAYSTSEFDSRLIFEIYKTLVVSRELGH